MLERIAQIKEDNWKKEFSAKRLTEIAKILCDQEMITPYSRRFLDPICVEVIRTVDDFVRIATDIDLTLKEKKVSGIAVLPIPSFMRVGETVDLNVQNRIVREVPIPYVPSIIEVGSEVHLSSAVHISLVEDEVMVPHMHGVPISEILEDPGALHLTIRGEYFDGLLTFYAAKDESGLQIIFEDRLMTSPRADVRIGRAFFDLYQHECKAVPLLVLSALGLSERGYVSLPKGNEQGYGGQKEILHINKLGSTLVGECVYDGGYRKTFAGNHFPSFYVNDAPGMNSSGWPTHVRADELLR